MNIAPSFCLASAASVSPLSFQFIPQEWSFLTEMYSVLAKRHFNFVKKNHAKDSRVCFNHYCFCSVHTLGFMVRCGFAKKENYSKKLCWKHTHFCFKKWEKHRKILYSNCFNVSFKCHRLTYVKKSLLAYSHMCCYQISHLKNDKCLS